MAVDITTSGVTEGGSEKENWWLCFKEQETVRAPDAHGKNQGLLNCSQSYFPPVVVVEGMYWGGGGYVCCLIFLLSGCMLNACF